MKVTQTIQLDIHERLALQKTLSLIDKMAELAHSSMSDVFSSLIDMAEITEEHGYSIKDLIEISEL